VFEELEEFEEFEGFESLKGLRVWMATILCSFVFNLCSLLLVALPHQ